MENYYSMGYQAFLEGVPMLRNPFMQGTREFFDWLEGWDDAEQHQLQCKIDFMIGYGY